MYKKQVCLFEWGYVVNDNEMRLKVKNRSHRYNINKPEPKHGHKYTKYEMSQYSDGFRY